MSNQREAIPEQIPQHPSQAESVDEETTLDQFIEGEDVDLSIIMKWAETVNEYAYELTTPPRPPSEFEELDMSQLKDIPVSECSAEEIVILIGWYWYHSGENKAIFHKECPEEQQNENQTVEEIKEDYSIIHRFDTQLDRININALAISIYSQETGTVNMDGFNQVEAPEGKAAVYYPPNVENAAVLIFNNGRGYYCCQSEVDVESIDEWFREEFDNWTDKGIVPLQLDDLD